MRTTIRSLFVFALLSLAAPAARADTLYAGQNSGGSITRIGRGIKELSLETQVVFSQRTDKEKAPQPEVSTTTLALLGGAVFRYFIVDNLMLGLHAGGFVRSASSKTGSLDTTVNGATVKIDGSETKVSENGFLGTLTAAYYASVGGGMFIAPLVGVGGFVGGSETTTPGLNGAPDKVDRASLSGLALRGGLGLVFYSSSRFNLFARPEAIVYIGSSKPKIEANSLPPGTPAPSADDLKRSFTRIDGGFTCGLSYVF